MIALAVASAAGFSCRRRFRIGTFATAARWCLGGEFGFFAAAIAAGRLVILFVIDWFHDVLGIAVAVEAAVFGAHLAGLLQPLAQLSPGTVQSDLQVSSCDPDFLGDGISGTAIKVGKLEHLSIFGPEGG